MINVIATNIDNATITSSGENPLYPFSDALTDSRLSQVGRTLLDSAQWVLFTFSAAVDVDTVCIIDNNFTSSATVKIQANATDVWTSPTVDQALTNNGGVWSYQFDTTQSYQYWRLYVDDATNPDTYIEIGFMFLDENTVFPGMSVNQVFQLDTNSDISFSTSGQAFGSKRLQFNFVSFTFPLVTEAQKTTLDTFFDEVDIVTPYLMFVWENSLDIQRPLYVVNTGLPEWRRYETDSGLAWTFNLTVREVF